MRLWAHLAKLPKFSEIYDFFWQIVGMSHRIQRRNLVPNGCDCQTFSQIFPFRQESPKLSRYFRLESFWCWLQQENLRQPKTRSNGKHKTHVMIINTDEYKLLTNHFYFFYNHPPERDFHLNNFSSHSRCTLT